MTSQPYPTKMKKTNIGQGTEYYLLVKRNEREWVPVLSPFIKTNHGSSGQFISSTWYKSRVPHTIEYAIVKIRTDCERERSKPVSTAMKLLDYISKLPEAKDIHSLDFLVMTQKFSNDYMNSVHHRLLQKMKKENSDTSSIQVRTQNDQGTFGLTFALRKGEEPCVYCPCFTLYP